jgi:PAS domain S-box-containing protein
MKLATGIESHATMGAPGPFGRLVSRLTPVRRRFAAEAKRHQRVMDKALASISEGLIACDAAGRVTLLNAVAESLTGWTLDQAAGRPLDRVLRLVDERTHEPVAGPAARVMRGEDVTVWAPHLALIARDGGITPVEYRAAPIQADEGRPTGVVMLLRDVTERRRVEDAMARLAAIVEYSDDAIVGISLDGVIQSWNDGAHRLFGYTADEIVGRAVTRLLPASRAGELEQILARIAEGERIKPFEGQAVHRDGQILDVSVTVSPLKDAEGRVIGASAIARDIAERQRAEQQARRAELLVRLAAAQEEERRHIARELHDQMGQHLAALMLGLEALKTETTDKEQVQRLQVLANQIGQEVHNLALELRPTALDDLGLPAALVHYVESWSERSGIAADYHTNGLNGDRLPSPVEIHLYRIIQEALTNVLKHSGARHVSVILERERDSLRAIVEDDGEGFEPAAVAHGPEAGSRLGLLGMKERAVALGGTLDIETAPGSGTSLFIRIPLSRASDGIDRA